MKCGGWGIQIRECEVKMTRNKFEPLRSVPMMNMGDVLIDLIMYKEGK